MKKMLFLLIVVFFATQVYADVILRKNGNTIKGTVIERTGNTIKVRLWNGVEATYKAEEIDSIDGVQVISVEQPALPEAPANVETTTNEEK
jgi:hypothetical protein